jgi:predicted Ser/Thr protein kinase
MDDIFKKLDEHNHRHRVSQWEGTFRDYLPDFYRVPVKRIILSEKDRIGIGTFVPSDPKSQDISELVGSIDLATVGEYGAESDPRAYRFDGELNIANRGMIEFIEMLKADVRREYDEIAKNDVQKAFFVSFEQEALTLLGHAALHAG